MSDHVLVLGATGAVGSELLHLLSGETDTVIAWSRDGRPGSANVDWQAGELFTDSLPAVDAILSAGPLDGLVAAWSRSPACLPGIVVALSSSSAAFKRESTNADERALAATLAASEAALLELGRVRGARVVVLRPTLIYGGDDAAHFGAVVAQARRFGRLVLPGSARGLRMPIHAADLAASMHKALRSNAAAGVFDVGGGETMAYDAMLERVLRARGLSTTLVRLPDRLFGLALKCAHAVGLMLALTEAVVARMREDLVVDDAPARDAFRHDPGPFRP